VSGHRVVRTLVLGATVALLAGAAAPRSPVKPAPGAGSAADRELLGASAARYRGLDRYEISGRLRLHVVGGAPEQTIDAPFTVAYQRPGKLRDEFRNPSGAMLQVSDGTERYEYLAQIQQYRRHGRPASDAAVADGTAGGNFAFGTGLVKMFGQIADSALTVTRLADEPVTIEGAARPCVVLEATYPAHSPGPGSPAEGPRTYWIDRRDHRLLRVRSTLTRNSPEGPVKVEQVTEFDRVRLGEPIADSLFAFTPPAGARLVNQWDLPGAHKSVDLTGQDARDFELTDLEGRRHRLSEQKGHVVLLDFWATWCGPCRITMPLVEKLEREYKPRGLIVYSINLRETREAAAAYIQKKGYGMVTLLDEKGTIGDSYQVNGIPALFIIGKDGKVSSQMVGVQSEEDLIEALEDAGLE